MLSWGNVISRFNDQKLIIEQFYGKARNRDYNFRSLDEKERDVLANAEDYLQEAKVLGMLDGVQEREYIHILESIDPKYLFKNSICFDPALIKKAGKDVASPYR